MGDALVRGGQRLWPSPDFHPPVDILRICFSAVSLALSAWDLQSLQMWIKNTRGYALIFVSDF